MQRRTGRFTTKHVERRRDTRWNRWSGHICAEDGVPASGKNSEQPRDQSERQSRLCLICLTRGSLCRSHSTISPSPEVLQIIRHQKCPRSSSGEANFWKRRLIKDEKTPMSEHTGCTRWSVYFIKKRLHKTLDYCQPCFARRTSDRHCKRNKTRSWLLIILTFLGLVTPQEVAETVAGYGVPAPTSGLATRCGPCETLTFFIRNGEQTRQLSRRKKIQAIKMEMLQRAAPVKMLICSPLHSCEIWLSGWRLELRHTASATCRRSALLHRLRKKEERRLVTCSKGTNTSTPIILKREAKITSAQTARRVFSFFGTPPHADRFECSLLCLRGGKGGGQENNTGALLPGHCKCARRPFPGFG